METVEKIKKLKHVSNSIRVTFQKMDEWEKRPSKYDKIGFGFNLDNRFSACEPLALSVDSWMGTYGDSGCSRVFHADGRIFRDHLAKVLSVNFKSIMSQVAVSIEAEAASLKEKALAELEQKNSEITSL